MTKFFLIDDDDAVIQILKIIIRDKNLGTVCGSSESAAAALELLPGAGPDIVIVDLLMPDMDGITFVGRAKPIMPDTLFVMLSQVSSKNMISKAYDAGIEFFIQKPVNGVEVNNVLERVIRVQKLERTMSSVQSLFSEGGGDGGAAVGTPVRDSTASELDTQTAPAATSEYRARLCRVFQSLGISGERGSDELTEVVCYFCQHRDELSDAKLSDICSKFSDSPKSMEQRLRRTAASGLSNVASIGLDDYGNETFERYAASLFKFEQVRREMDYLKGNSAQHGNVQIKKFIIALVNECMD